MIQTMLVIGAIDPWAIGGLSILVIVMLGLVIIAIKYGSLWFEGYNCGAQIGLFELVMMGLRQVNQKSIMKAKIKAVQANLRTEKDKTPGVEIDGTFVTTQRLEAHYLAGGDVTKIIEALVASKNAGIALEFDQAAAIDLAGRDVVEAVRTSVDPKVISCPDPQRSGKEFLSAVAKDGVELKVHAQVTVRTNLEQLIGGATEETIIARVGESIISAIGSATLHSDVLQNPGMITKAEGSVLRLTEKLPLSPDSLDETSIAFRTIPGPLSLSAFVTLTSGGS